MRNSWLTSCCSLVLLLAPLPFAAQARAVQADSVSSREFVERFYRWYVQEALRQSSSAAWNVALERRSSAFAPELARLLREDSTAQAACAELIGLDFDPFLNTQDPAMRYEVGKITREGRRYRAAIFGVQGGRRSEKPDVSAEFARRQGRWIFVNFYYPDGTNLLMILKSPRPRCSAPR